jgi:hypothetical protein
VQQGTGRRASVQQGGGGNRSPSFAGGDEPRRQRSRVVLGKDEYVKTDNTAPNREPEETSSSPSKIRSRTSSKKESKYEKDEDENSDMGLDTAALQNLHAAAGLGARRGAPGRPGRSSVSQSSGDMDLVNRVKGESSGRHRRGSVKEIDSLPEPAPASSGRHRRGSVKEVQDAYAMEATASAPVSSGRHRRGSVKEIDAAPQGSSSSGRHRRGSVREIDPGKATHAGNLGFHKLRSSSGAQPSSPTPAAARRHRRLSVGDAPVEMPASPLPPGKVVTGLEGLISGQADMGSMGVSRRQNRGLERSPSSKNLGGGGRSAEVLRHSRAEETLQAAKGVPFS